MKKTEGSGRFGTWFLRHVVLETLVAEFPKKVHMGTRIEKALLYQRCSWWWRFNKRQTRRVLTALAREFEDIQFSNRGLWIPRRYFSLLRDGKLPEEETGREAAQKPAVQQEAGEKGAD